MDNLPILIEFCGVPYSRKTTTINKIGKLLRQNNVNYKIVDEYRGESLFYNSAKRSFDLNVARSLRCLQDVISDLHSGDSKVILIDRGPFDTFCWVSWFRSRKSVPPEIEEFAKCSIDLMNYYSTKYRVVWMDIDPLLSVAQHGHQGTVVNINTVKELQSIYGRSRELLADKAAFTRFDSGAVNSDLAAERLYHQLKL